MSKEYISFKYENSVSVVSARYSEVFIVIESEMDEMFNYYKII